MPSYLCTVEAERCTSSLHLKLHTLHTSTIQKHIILLYDTNNLVRWVKEGVKRKMVSMMMTFGSIELILKLSKHFEWFKVYVDLSAVESFLTHSLTWLNKTLVSHLLILYCTVFPPSTIHVSVLDLSKNSEGEMERIWNGLSSGIFLLVQ